MEETQFRSNFTAPFPNGVVYCFNSRRNSSSVVHQDPSSSSSCSLMEVTISNNNDSFLFPCFSCSGFVNIEHYHNDFRSILADTITNAVVLPSPHCANTIARDVLHSVLIPAIASQPDNILRIIVQVKAPLHEEDEYEEEEDEYYEEEEDEYYYEEEEEDEYYEEEEDEYYEEEDDDDVSRVLGESFEEAGPQRKPCKTESVMEMYMERFELEDLESEKAERDWKESGSHDCVICIEEIESIWESLKMPCSHVFHEKCLLIWLNEDHVCPLCRFKLPLEDMIDAHFSCS